MQHCSGADAGLECAALIASIDWSKTPLGPREKWAASLRTFVPIMLASGVAMRVFWGPELVLLYNDAYRPILANKHPGAMGSRFVDTFPEAWPVIVPLFRRAYAGEAVSQEDLAVPLERTGYLEECYFTVSYSPIHDDQAAVGGLVGIGSETTTRVLAERRLALLRRLAEAMTVAEDADHACRLAARALAENPRDVPFALLYLLATDGRVARLSAGFGLERYEVARPLSVDLGSSSDAGWPLGRAAQERRPMTVSDLGRRFGELHAGSWPEPLTTAIVLPVVGLDGRPRGFVVVGVSPRRPLDDRYRTFLDLTSQHIAAGLNHAFAYTETRQRARESLRESEERYRLLFETTPLPLCVYDPETLAFLEVNEAFVQSYGYSREELTALTIADIRYPRDVAALREDIARRRAETVAGVSVYAERQNQKKDGSIMTVDIKGRDFAFQGKPARLALFIDLTERERAQEALRATEAQLRQAQKMEAVGRLAGGVAHDFNNVLTVILSYSEMVLGKLEPGEPMRGDIEEIRRAAMRAAELTRQLLMFSRQTVLEPKVLDLNDLLASMEKMLRRLIGEDVELVFVSASSLGKVRADPGSMEQVIMNLVVNARDAMPKGGKLTIETANATLDEAGAHERLGVKPGPHVLLAVSDTGTGIDRATQARIFEPFFTTKEIGKGTGLGLSTVFGIVQQSGGVVWVDSELGKGATFKVYLPLVEAAADAARLHIAPATLRGSETILLVEDEEQVRTVARGILELHGYRVLEAQNAGEALLLCEQHSGAIDLLLSDVVMPQMSGPELARRVMTAWPMMKVLCMSGYMDDRAVRHGAPEAGIAVIQKPFTPGTLTTKVREVLDG